MSEDINFCSKCGTQLADPRLKRYRAERGGFAIRTEDFRCPKKGEYYLSGAVPVAYIAPNDLGQKFRIMKLVGGA